MASLSYKTLTPYKLGIADPISCRYELVPLVNYKLDRWGGIELETMI